MTCPACSSARAIPLPEFDSGEWRIARCADCGFVYLANPPAYEALEEEFSWEKSSESHRIQRETEGSRLQNVASQQSTRLRRGFFRRRKIHDLAVRYMPYPPAAIVDIGCAKGNAVANLHAELLAAGNSCTPIGIEISAELSRAAHKKLKKLGGRCLSRNALAGLRELPADSATLILMSAYLEHERAPREVLAESARCLRQGGILVIKVPNFNSWNRRLVRARWCGFRYPDHVCYFTPRTLRSLLESSGLAVARMNLLDRFPFSDNMYVVARKP